MCIVWSCPPRLRTSDSCYPAMSVLRGRVLWKAEVSQYVSADQGYRYFTKMHHSFDANNATRNTAQTKLKLKLGQTPGLTYWPVTRPSPARPKSLTRGPDTKPAAHCNKSHDCVYLYWRSSASSVSSAQRYSVWQINTSWYGAVCGDGCRASVTTSFEFCCCMTTWCSRAAPTRTNRSVPGARSVTSWLLQLMITAVKHLLFICFDRWRFYLNVFDTSDAPALQMALSAMR